MARRHDAQLMTREIGMALAVLALWMMSLLAPLHQTSGLLRDLADAGHKIASDWSICVTLADAGTADSQTDTHPDVFCPAHGIGKTALATPPEAVRLADVIGLPSHAQHSKTALPPPREHLARTPRQPRAPPAMI